MHKHFLLSVLLVSALSGCAKRNSAAGASGAGVKKGSGVSAASGSAPTQASNLPPVGPQLSDLGFRCEIGFVSPPAEYRLGGMQLPVKVRVTKRTSESWPVQTPGGSPVHAVNLGYHWLDGKTANVVKEGGRTMLPAGIADGATVELDIMVTPPGGPGEYVLKVEPVQEGVAWFSEKSTCYQTTHITAKM